MRLIIKEPPKFVTKLKHIDIKQHWLRKKVEKGEIDIKWISILEQAADGLTKPLSVQKHATFLKQLNISDITNTVERLERK